VEGAVEWLAAGGDDGDYQYSSTNTNDLLDTPKDDK